MHGATDAHGLSCDTKKTDVVLQSAPGKLHNDPLITVNGQILIYLIFIYPGSSFSITVCIDD